ncbi:MAG: hypothetical protein JRI25_28975, partial [Deltaproteobacteria bacterium]|nr:hypothetical protein [Deltaproteobacteria bacterium]
MALLLLYALVPVLVGVAFAFAPGLDRRFLGPLQTGAIAAALTVVLAELLPEATSTLGVAALGAFAAGLAVPVGLEVFGRRLARVRRKGRHGFALEAAFLGLMVHQVGDGLQVGAAGVIEDGMSVIFAVAAHTTPLIAVTVLAYAHHDGRRTA